MNKTFKELDTMIEEGKSLPIETFDDFASVVEKYIDSTIDSESKIQEESLKNNDAVGYWLCSGKISGLALVKDIIEYVYNHQDNE